MRRLLFCLLCTDIGGASAFQLGVGNLATIHLQQSKPEPTQLYGCVLLRVDAPPGTSRQLVCTRTLRPSLPSLFCVGGLVQNSVLNTAWKTWTARSPSSTRTAQALWRHASIRRPWAIVHPVSTSNYSYLPAHSSRPFAATALMVPILPLARASLNHARRRLHSRRARARKRYHRHLRRPPRTPYAALRPRPPRSSRSSSYYLANPVPPSGATSRKPALEMQSVPARVSSLHTVADNMRRRARAECRTLGLNV